MLILELHINTISTPAMPEMSRQMAGHLLLQDIPLYQCKQTSKVHLEDYLLNHKFKGNNLELPKRKQHSCLSPAFLDCIKFFHNQIYCRAEDKSNFCSIFWYLKLPFRRRLEPQSNSPYLFGKNHFFHLRKLLAHLIVLDYKIKVSTNCNHTVNLVMPFTAEILGIPYLVSSSCPLGMF